LVSDLSIKHYVLRPTISSILTSKASAIFLRVLIVGLSFTPDHILTRVVSVTFASFAGLFCDRPFSFLNFF